MENFQKICERCGGNLLEEKNKYICSSCTSEFVKHDQLKNNLHILLNKAMSLRHAFSFEESLKQYEEILDIDQNNIEAHWGYLLSKLGVIYVNDNHEYKPTCNRLTFDKITNEPNFIIIMNNASEDEKKWYVNEANKIENIRQKLMHISNAEAPYDIFISFKAKHEDRPTLDSQYATDLYYDLTKKGYRVFMSRISLNDIVGEDYEPYIYNALNTAKLMILIATKNSFLDSPWVKNEWSRYLKLQELSQFKKKIIPLYKDVDISRIDSRLRTIQSLNIGDLNSYSTLNKNIDAFLNDSLKTQADKSQSKKIDIRSLKQISKKKKNIKTLTLKKLQPNLSIEKDITMDEKNTISSGYLFLDNGVFELAKSHFLKVYEKNKNNTDLLLGLILSELSLSTKVFELEFDIKPLKYSSTLKIYLSDLLNVLTYSDEHKKLIHKLTYLCKIVLTHMKGLDDSIRVFLTLFETIIKIQNEDFIKSLLDEFLLDLEYKEIIMSSEQLENTYCVIRDILLNYDLNGFGKNIYRILTQFSDKDEYIITKIITVDALGYTPSNLELNRLNLMLSTKASSYESALMHVIQSKSFRLIDQFLASIDNPRVEIVDMLNLIRGNEIFISKLQLKKIITFSTYVIQYLPNFSVSLYVEQLDKLGYYCLKYNQFQEALKIFKKNFSHSKSELSLWGIVLAKAKCSDEYELFRKKIELIEFDEYNQLVSVSQDINYYNQLYLAIKKENMTFQIKDAISNRWQILEG